MGLPKSTNNKVPTLTGKARAEEIVKCGQDPIYFMKHYVNISHPDKGIIKFDTYPFQDECVKAFEDNRFNIVLKSRQLGLSTVCAAYCLWMAIFQKEKNILVIATKLEVAKNFLRKVRQMFESLPPWLVLPAVKAESVRYLDFSNGSRITAIPTGDDAGRSEAVSLLVVDEAAHIEKFDYHWVGLYSTVTHGGKCIILSTPKGVGNQFHKLWVEAKNSMNDFNPIELPWYVHPEHDEEWFKKETRNLDKRGVAQELLCDFQASGQTYIDAEQIQWLTDAVLPPIARFDSDPNVWIWKKPLSGRKYIIAADVAKGNGADFSTFHVIDTQENEVVAEYQGKRPPDLLAELLVSVGEVYNDALICNEANSFGLATSYKLRDMKYPNLYYEKFAKIGNVLERSYTPMEVEGETPGFTTSSKNRTQVLAKLEEVIRNKKIKIYSSRFAEEVKTLIWTGTRAQAQKNYNDDLVMSLAIACWIFDMGDGVPVDQTALNNAMLMAMSVNSKTFTSNNYNQVTNRIKDDVPVSPMSFMRSNSHDSRFVNTPGKKIPPGVSQEQFQQAVEIYNMYHWLLGK